MNKNSNKKTNQINKYTHKQDDPKKKVAFPIDWKENEKKKLEIESNVIKTCSWLLNCYQLSWIA